MQVEIGVAFETPYGLVEYTKEDLSEITSKPVSIKRLPDLAGDNNVLQILGDAEFWKLLAVALITVYGKGFIEEAGKDSWRSIAKNAKTLTNSLTSPFKYLLDRLSGYTDPEQPNPGNAILAVPIGQYTRNAGIDVRGYSEEEIASLIIIMSRHAAAVQAHIEACLSSGESVIINFETNPDASIKLVPNNDGSVSLSWTQWESAPTQLKGESSKAPDFEEKTITFK